MTSQLNVNTIVDKPGTGGTNIKMSTGATAVSDGGATTTNVVQGLIKFWLNLDGQSTISTRDSFNISGVVDEGEGQYTPSYSNSMGNANYSMGCNTDYDGIEYSINCKVIATGSHKIQSLSRSGLQRPFEESAW